jgi:hypothetical protein
MDQDTDHVKRIAALEYRVAELEASVEAARRGGLIEAAEILLRIAQSRKPMGVASAAQVIRDLAGASSPMS